LTTDVGTSRRLQQLQQNNKRNETYTFIGTDIGAELTPDGPIPDRQFITPWLEKWKVFEENLCNYFKKDQSRSQSA